LRRTRIRGFGKLLKQSQEQQSEVHRRPKSMVRRLVNSLLNTIREYLLNAHAANRKRLAGTQLLDSRERAEHLFALGGAHSATNFAPGAIQKEGCRRGPNM
jgi:hypothetical protein